MTCEHMKSCSITFEIRETQIKTDNQIGKDPKVF